MTRNKNFQIDEPIFLGIGELADKLGIQAYVVGGYVRDLILGDVEDLSRGKNKDIDVMVIADPISFAREVERKLSAAALVVFEKFRTAQMTIGGVKVEIVGARKETYDMNSRKPHVNEANLEEDLSRRDFTINAMAISLNKSQISESNFGELSRSF